MKISQDKLLYSMIADYQSRMRIELDDWTFDAYEDLSNFLGHKSPSTLRKWTGPDSSRCNAKLGFDDAMKLMDRMNDYRLLEFMRESLIERKQAKQQLNLFSQPLHEI